MTNPMTTPQPDDTPIPLDSYHSASGELRALARVLRAALGVVVAHWAATGVPAAHPYRQAAGMVDGYLRRRYGV